METEYYQESPAVSSIFLCNGIAAQGRIFPKIQPTTICWIELTSDKNQAKTQ